MERTSGVLLKINCLFHLYPFVMFFSVPVATDKMDGIKSVVEEDTSCAAGEQQSARKSPDRRENTTGILRVVSKPRLGSGSGVEFRSPPGPSGSTDLNVMASYPTFLHSPMISLRNSL
jgi:hypothetical protein